jgi:P27 family predicted phage terminase small subunit
MGRRGPPPTPTNLLKLRGSPLASKRRHATEPKPDPTRPRCPAWLDDEAKLAWRQLIPQLDAMRVLTRIDGNALTRYCQLWARWKKAELFMQKHGDTYPLKDESGRIKCLMQFPQVASANKLAAQLTRLEQEFGMTPSARTRISVPVAQIAPDPVKARFFGGA